MWNRLGRTSRRGLFAGSSGTEESEIRRRRAMIKSINVWALPGGLANEIDPVDAMRQAKAAGFDGIELGIGEAGAFTPKTKQAQCEQWRKEAKKIGIQIVS